MSIPARSRGALDTAIRTSRTAARIEVPVLRFIHTEGASGIVLLCMAVAAVICANSPLSDRYFALWHATISFNFGTLNLSRDLHHWINDGLMALFFFLVGMEIKHELLDGQLSNVRRAALPVVAAIGGMVWPALLYLTFNYNGPGSAGWGVPMATDIAFALAVLAVVPDIPVSLKVFLLALAIVDDLGAIMVIAIFYTSSINWQPLALATLLLGVILALRAAEVRIAFPYVLLGVLVWRFVLESGVHATIAGVALAMVVNGRSKVKRESFLESATSLVNEFSSAMSEGNAERADVALGALDSLVSVTESTLERLTRQLHVWVSFIVLPLFAFANAGVVIDGQALLKAVREPISLGIAAGLLLGKPIGIVAFSWIAVRLGLVEMPESVRWGHLWGVGMVAGIGFTVAIFIADLAFPGPEQLQSAKLAILVVSVIGGCAGYLTLRSQRALRASS